MFIGDWARFANIRLGSEGLNCRNGPEFKHSREQCKIIMYIHTYHTKYCSIGYDSKFIERPKMSENKCIAQKYHNRDTENKDTDDLNRYEYPCPGRCINSRRLNSNLVDQLMSTNHTPNFRIWQRHPWLWIWAILKGLVLVQLNHFTPFLSRLRFDILTRI